jgi:hypothetical protein
MKGFTVRCLLHYHIINHNFQYVNDVLFVDSHVEASLKLLFQVLENIGVRLCGEVPGCPVTLCMPTTSNLSV